MRCGCSAAMAVRIAIRAGDEDRAAAVVREIERLARLNEHVPSIAGCAMHATGLLRPDVDRLRRAVHLLRGSPRPLALAFVLEDLGRAMIATGERAAAVPVLEETLTIFRAVGASADATLVQRSLRGIGVRTPQRSIRQGLGRGWDTLTSTERAVAGLVAEGLTNRGIAERMFVSSSTVNTHLRHIFTKLGISSRVHLTLLAAAPSTE